MNRGDPIDATELLLVQHRRLERLLRELVQASTGDTRRHALAAAGDELSLHMLAEEQVLYPALHSRRTDDSLLEFLEEHLSLKRLVADLMALDTADPRFAAKAKVLAEQAIHHHGEEEEHLFPAAHLLLDTARREQLGQDILRFQGRLRRTGQAREALVGSSD